MTHGSLFSGIGGFDLAAEWMGWHNAFHCEIDSFCSTVLKYHFPYARHYTDIRASDERFRKECLGIESIGDREIIQQTLF